MNALYFLTTVMKTHTARTLMARSCVLVAVDILEMELFAKVSEIVMAFKMMH